MEKEYLRKQHSHELFGARIERHSVTGDEVSMLEERYSNYLALNVISLSYSSSDCRISNFFFILFVRLRTQTS